jgi:PEP-CTERM motif
MYRNFTRLVGAALIGSAGFAPSLAKADAMHVYCDSPTPTCVDAGSYTPTWASSPFFSFTLSGSMNKTDTGDFLLEVLIPDNLGTNSESFSVGCTTCSNTSVTSSIVNSLDEWNSGKLSTYVGISAHPQNPIGNFLPNTQIPDPGAEGFWVYQLDFGDVTFGTGHADPEFSLKNGFTLPAGAWVLGYVDCGGWIATANSSSLLEEGTPVPEPASLAIFGAALIGFAGFAAIRRRRRPVA